MFSVLTEGLAQEGPKAAELKPIAAPVAPETVIAASSGHVVVSKNAIIIAAGILCILVLAYLVFRPKRAINVIAEKAEYNALFDAPFSSLPGPLMKMPADHLRPPTGFGTGGTGGAAAGAHTGYAEAPYSAGAGGPPQALENLVMPDDIVPVNGPIPIWGDESVTEKAEPKVDEGSMDIKRLIAERESFNSALEREMASALKAQGAAGLPAQGPEGRPGESDGALEPMGPPGVPPMAYANRI